MPKKLKTNNLTADDFPIELGKTYYSDYDGQTLPCTPTPQLSKRGIFEAKQLFKVSNGFKKSDLRFEFVFIDPDDGEFLLSMKASKVYRSLVNMRKRGCQCVVDTKGFYCKKCHKPMTPRIVR